MSRAGTSIVCAYLTLVLPTSVHAIEVATPSGSAEQCRYVIAYEAPATCPDAAAVERRLGPGFRVQRGTLDDCPTCAREVHITESNSTFRMQLGGLEATAVLRPACEELVDLAVYAVEASDLPKPDCGSPIGRIGVATTPLVNLTNVDPMLLTSLRATVTLGQWWFAPSGVWLLPTQVNNRVPGTTAAHIGLSGYGAGLDVCRGVHARVHLCGAGMWRRVSGVLSGGDWEPAATDIWSLGGGMTWDWPLLDALHVEIAPTVMAVLGEPRLTEPASPQPLYAHTGVEAQLRVGFSWELGVSSTPINTAGIRTSARPISSNVTPSLPRRF